MYPYVLVPFSDGMETLIPLTYIIFCVVSCRICWKLTQESQHPPLRFWLIFTQVFNILLQSSSMIIRYVVRSRPLYFFNMIMTITNALQICMIQIQVLAIFGILDDRITARLLKKLRLFVILCYIILVGPICTRPFIRNFPSDLMIGSLIFAFGSVLFDNSLVLYMTLLVYRSNKKKHHESAIQAFKRAISLSLCVMLMDWVSLGFLCWMYAAASYTTTLYNILEYLLVLTSGVHCCLLYLVFLRIRDLALTGLKKYPQRALPQNTQTVLLDTKHIETSTKDTQLQ
jgi:hypothetical protein